MSLSLSRTSLVVLLSASPLLAQTPTPGPVSADVVVTAEALPETVGALPVAATVIERAEIERSKATSALELLRTVPGLDLVQSGGPGAAASAFLRGANSAETLFLIDGVKVNSPFFGSFDLSSLDTTNVERIEVVRGPFSALYGSDAIGGVVQIFTRRAATEGFSGRGTLAAGDARTREGTLFASLAEGIVHATAGFRRATTDGTLPNEFFSATNASATLEVAPSPELRAGIVVRRDDGRTGIPFSGGAPSPHRSTAEETTTVAVPITLALGASTTLEAAPTFVRETLTFQDPDDPFAFTHERTSAERIGGRATLSQTLGFQRLSLGAEYETARVTDVDAFAVELDERSTHTWAAFLEDRVSLMGDRLVATLGIRHDEQSAFGGSTNPRVALAFRINPRVKLRAAAGGAFRSPTTGELYYPFSGNPALRPERANSYELGGDVTLAPRLTFETSLFYSTVRDLITYDFATGTDQNVGRARSRGVEVGLTGPLASRLVGRVSYTWLEAVDRDTGALLLRRPRHRASATVGWEGPRGASAQLTALFVGRRADVDAITFARVTDPAYFRFDAALTLPRFLERLSPWVRVTNVLARRYAEAAGFPAPGRRLLAGLEVGF